MFRVTAQFNQFYHIESLSSIVENLSKIRMHSKYEKVETFLHQALPKQCICWDITDNSANSELATSLWISMTSESCKFVDMAWFRPTRQPGWDLRRVMESPCANPGLAHTKPLTGQLSKRRWTSWAGAIILLYTCCKCWTRADHSCADSCYNADRPRDVSAQVTATYFSGSHLMVL